MHYMENYKEYKNFYHSQICLTLNKVSIRIISDQNKIIWSLEEAGHVNISDGKTGKH